MNFVYETPTERVLAFALPYALALSKAADENFGFDRSGEILQGILRFSAGGADAYLFAVSIHFITMFFFLRLVVTVCRAVR